MRECWIIGWAFSCFTTLTDIILLTLIHCLHHHTCNHSMKTAWHQHYYHLILSTFTSLLPTVAVTNGVDEEKDEIIDVLRETQVRGEKKQNNKSWMIDLFHVMICDGSISVFLTWFIVVLSCLWLILSISVLTIY